MDSGPLRVLITGASGLLGTILRERLPADRFDVDGVDLVGGDGVRAVDLRDPDGAASSVAGHDMVVDLAGIADDQTSWPDVHGNNMLVTGNVARAAVKEGVRRVVYASSCAVVAGYEKDEPYSSIVAGRRDGLTPSEVPLLDTRVSPRPLTYYGTGKVFGEGIYRYATDAHGISTICLRMGSVKAADQPSKPRHLAVLLTQRDFVQLVERSLLAPESVRHAAYYGASNNTWRIWDLEQPRNEIGFEPEDDAERLPYLG